MKGRKSWPEKEDLANKLAEICYQSSLVRYQEKEVMICGGLIKGYECMVKYIPKGYLLIQINYSTFSRVPGHCVKRIIQVLENSFGLEPCCSFKSPQRLINGIYPKGNGPDDKFLMIEYHPGTEEWYRARQKLAKVDHSTINDLKKLFKGKRH